jgi:hypothetical protein
LLDDPRNKVIKTKEKKMKRVLKKSMLAAALSGAVLASALAQDTPAPTQQQPSTPQEQEVAPPAFAPMGQRGGRGPGHHEGRGGFGLFRGLELGSTLTVTFYDGNPDEGATALSTLNFTYGEDSEVAFQRQFEEARATAAFVRVEVSEQTRTVDLADFTEDERQNLRPRELFRPEALNDGSTITATFYDGDPEAGGTVTETLTFTYGVSSAAGFADDFATAAETAAFVTITTSPQTRTIDLAAMPVGREGFGPGFGRPDFGGPRGPR